MVGGGFQIARPRSPALARRRRLRDIDFSTCAPDYGAVSSEREAQPRSFEGQKV